MTLNKPTMECACGANAREFRTEFHGYSVRGWKCSKCKEEYLDPRDVEPILKLLKSSKQHKLKSVIGVVGNSFTVRVPKIIADVYGITKGEMVEYVPEKEGILIKLSTYLSRKTVSEHNKKYFHEAA